MNKLSLFLILFSFSFVHLWAEEKPSHSVPKEELSLALEEEYPLRSVLLNDGFPEYTADSIAIYTNGRDKFNALFSDLREARRTIDVEYFIIADDSISACLLDLLRIKQLEGVQVRLVIDSYKDVSRSYGHTQAWCDTVPFDARLFDPWKFPYVNKIARDHRKIVVVDDSIGYIGGLNVADYYVNGKPESYGGWRDTHIRITGQAVQGLMIYFEDAWRRCGGDARNLMGNEVRFDSVQNSARYSAQSSIQSSAQKNAATPFVDKAVQTGTDPARIIYFERSRESHEKKAETRRSIVKALRSAKDTLRIVSPYFLPTHSVRQALIDAIDRGVHVEVLFSKIGDEPILSVGNYDFAKRLTRHGAKVWLYNGAFHHSKIMMIDGHTSMVGSANLNSRSLRWDYEASCFVFDRTICARLDSIFEEDKKQCDLFSIESYKEEFPRGRRIYGWLVNRFLTPVL